MISGWPSSIQSRSPFPYNKAHTWIISSFLYLREKFFFLFGLFGIKRGRIINLPLLFLLHLSSIWELRIPGDLRNQMNKMKAYQKTSAINGSLYPPIHCPFQHLSEEAERARRESLRQDWFIHSSSTEDRLQRKHCWSKEMLLLFLFTVIRKFFRQGEYSTSLLIHLHLFFRALEVLVSWKRNGNCNQ